MSAPEESERVLKRFRKGEQESYSQFARRLYEAHIDVYAAHGGYDFPSWEAQEPKVRHHWVKRARRRCKKARRMARKSG